MSSASISLPVVRHPRSHAQLGATLFLEVAPGHVSTHLVAALFPDVRAVSIADQGLRYATVLAVREHTSDGEGGNELVNRL